MRLWRRFALASVLSALLGQAAHAATIFTPPVIPDDDGDFFCLVTNVSAQILTIRIAVLNVNGETSRQLGFTVPPLATRAAPGHGASSDRLCQITVDAGRNAVRASVELFSSTSAIETVVPVP